VGNPPDSSSGSGALLEVAGVTKRFGAVAAIDGVDMCVRPGEVHGVIGPNGAGKTTLISLISGAHRLDGGRVLLGGRDITGLDASRRARLGVGRTHQVPRTFPQLTVLENLLLAQHNGGSVRSRHRALATSRDILARTGLAEAAGRQTRDLPLLARKRLELARALALEPRILLLDEIGAGLSEPEIEELISLIASLRAQVEGILLVEHVLDIVTGVCDRVTVLELGRVLICGTPTEVLSDKAVAAAYMGTTAASDRTQAEPAPGRAPAAGPLAAAPPPAPDQDQAARVSAAPALVVEGVSAHYGGVRALRSVSIEVRQGEVVALLGANGAGKTTLADVVMGVVRADTGRIVAHGVDVTRRQPHEISALGVAHCMEGRRIFGDLSVEENLRLPAAVSRRTVQERLDRVYSLFPELAELRRRSGTALSGGQQQMLAIGRALMGDPSLIIFDEISLGLAPIVIQRIYESLGRLRSSGTAMLLIEQNIERALDLADYVYVLSRGSVALSGHPAKIQQGPALAGLYLGAGDPDGSA
jgi:branched-chain amino acid transport system ATP-binding protein